MTMKRRLPIGVSDFKEIIEEDLYFVDKSLIIKDLIDDGSKVILLARPRRFGKTLNMSMIKNFFEKTDDNTQEDKICLFKDLNVWKHEYVREYFGKYPVIYITFKDIKNLTWKDCYLKIVQLIIREYNKNIKLLEENSLNPVDKKYFNRILNGEATMAEYEESLKYLTEFMVKAYKSKVILLIDEYDVPIQGGYLNGYYDEVINFMRNFLSGGLKDNENLQKAVLTGILRIAKESIFSGLNNLNVCTILNNKYSRYFGFEEKEVEKMLAYYGIETKMEEVKRWYNGYIFGNDVIYNPWSIIKYIENSDEGFMPYWVNTSSNDLVKNLITKGDAQLKQELQSLIRGEAIEKYINEDIVMNEIEQDTENVWSFLFFSGYLKVVKKQRNAEGELKCHLAIPNIEVSIVYRGIILNWFKANVGMDKYRNMLNALIKGDIKPFSKLFKDYVLKSISYFDVSGQEQEKIYHAFVLGMLVSLNETHQVKSNRESGYGRYDVMLIPREKKEKGIIIEFKKVDEDENETLEISAQNALKQIEDRSYEMEMKDNGIDNIIKLGISFKGKEVLILSK
jgi:hypothetical protein